MSDSDSLSRPESAMEPIARPNEGDSSAKPLNSKLWWLTAFCGALAVGLLAWSWSSKGLHIKIRFRDGHGLRAENRLMHRGIEVGVVERVELDKDLKNVEVQVWLNQSANAIACEGSRFWIERPMASVQGVRSLETLVSGRYIAVEPGPESSKRVNEFQGLDQPPQPAIPSEALEIILEADERHGLQVNAPMIYRGLEVGRLQSIGLSADGRWVQVRAMIEADYRNLVRENSRFWNRSGFRVDVGLSGVDIDAESLASIAIGGIEFATPDPPSEAVKTGRRFALASKAEKEWTQWKPRMLYGAVLPNGLDTALSPMRLSLRWQERLFGFRKKESRSGWILILSDDTVVGPSDLFEPPSSAIDGSVRWEVAGVEFSSEQMTPMEKSQSKASSNSIRVNRRRIADIANEIPRWPVERLAILAKDSFESKRLWIACDLPSRWIPVDPHQLSPRNEDEWRIDPSLGISEAEHGAPVLDGESAKVVGVVIVEPRSARIMRLR